MMYFWYFTFENVIDVQSIPTTTKVCIHFAQWCIPETIRAGTSSSINSSGILPAPRYVCGEILQCSMVCCTNMTFTLLAGILPGVIPRISE